MTVAVENPTFIEGLYNYGLFFTFFVAGAAYLLLSLIPGYPPEVSEERQAVPE
jgi:NCS1 family nucleobase:cation symporter-1